MSNVRQTYHRINFICKRVVRNDFAQILYHSQTVIRTDMHFMRGEKLKCNNKLNDVGLEGDRSECNLIASILAMICLLTATACYCG